MYPCPTVRLDSSHSLDSAPSHHLNLSRCKRREDTGRVVCEVCVRSRRESREDRGLLLPSTTRKSDKRDEGGTDLPAWTVSRKIMSRVSSFERPILKTESSFQTHLTGRGTGGSPYLRSGVLHREDLGNESKRETLGPIHRKQRLLDVYTDTLWIFEPNKVSLKSCFRLLARSRCLSCPDQTRKRGPR